MGQNQIKAGLSIRLKAQSLADNALLRLHSVQELKSLTYDTFLHEVELLNQITDELTKDTEKTVLFSVTNASKHGLLWKATTKILCDKIQRDTGVVLTRKVLSVRRFLRLYADIMHQMSAITAARANEAEPPSPSSDFCASMILDGLDASSLSRRVSVDSSSNECCICMERDCDIILSCTHGFCEQCIDTWCQVSNNPRVTQGSSSTCPVCRDPVNSPDNHWVLAEGHHAEHEEMPALVLGLVEKAEGQSVAPTSSSRSRPNSQATEPSQCVVDEEINSSLRVSSIPEGYTLVSYENHSSEHNGLPQQS